MSDEGTATADHGGGAGGAFDASPPLADLQDAVLDAGTVDQLFFDIAHAAELLTVVVKGRAASNASIAELSLEEARAALHEGDVFGVQIRYRHGDAEWWDTLMRVPSGIRLVRVKQVYA